MPRKSKKAPKASLKGMDSREWKVPLDPPETTAASFYFSVQGGLDFFGYNYATGQTGAVAYGDVVTAIRKSYGISGNTANLSIRVTRYAVYGPPSSLSPDSSSIGTTTFKLYVEDSYTGRIVQDSSTPMRRAHVGISQNALRKLKWYNGSNNDTIPEQTLFYARSGDGSNSNCLKSDEDQKVTIVVQGFARMSKPMALCS